MLPYNAPKNSQGFTLIETLTTVIIVGILSAIAAPSFLAQFNKSKLNDAVDEVRGALQECQRQAIRKTQSDSVTLVTDTDTTNTPTTYKIIGSCLVTGNRTLPAGVAMAHNIEGGNRITFGIQGNTSFEVNISTDTTGKIILYQPASTSDMKCVAISNGIGIIRSGTYSGPISPASDITDTGICNASY